jgi:hypothetical protein
MDPCTDVVADSGSGRSRSPAVVGDARRGDDDQQRTPSSAMRLPAMRPMNQRLRRVNEVPLN